MTNYRHNIRPHIHIIRIIQSFDVSLDQKFYKEFVIVANVMEIMFAASNFYLYCPFLPLGLPVGRAQIPDSGGRALNIGRH